MIYFKKEFKRFNSYDKKYFTQWYSVVLDYEVSQFVLQKEEVDEIKWFTKEELMQEIQSHREKYLKSLEVCIKYFA